MLIHPESRKLSCISFLNYTEKNFTLKLLTCLSNSEIRLRDDLLKDFKLLARIKLMLDDSDNHTIDTVNFLFVFLV